MRRMLSMLLLIIVAIGFSGIASATQELVSPAYNESQLVTPAYNESQLVDPAYNETIPQVNGTIDHPEVNHTEQQIVTPETTESVFDHYMVNGAYQLANGTQVPYFNNGPYYNPFPYWPDINAWAAWIYTNPGAVGGYGCWNAIYNVTIHPAVYQEVVIVDTPAWIENIIVSPEQVIFHNAVYQSVFHDAVYNIIFHPAVYQDVTSPVKPVPFVPVVSPSTPVKAAEVPEVATTIPMQKTGGDLWAFVAAILFLIIGLIAAIRRV